MSGGAAGGAGDHATAITTRSSDGATVLVKLPARLVLGQTSTVLKWGTGTAVSVFACLLFSHSIIIRVTIIIIKIIIFISTIF